MPCASSASTASVNAALVLTNTPTSTHSTARSTSDTRERAQMMFMCSCNLEDQSEDYRDNKARCVEMPQRASCFSNQFTLCALGQAIPAATHRLDHRIAARRLERRAQTLDVHVDRA